MIRLLLAVSLVCAPAGFSRAEQDDAYGNLIGMADSASSDKGPDAGEIPPDTAARPNSSSGEPSKAESPTDESPKPEAAAAPAPVKPAQPVRPAARERADDDSAAVAAPATPAPRVWTRVFAALMPPMTRIDTFEVASSTVPARPRAASAPRPVTVASDAGSALGLRELVSTATAPALR